MNPLTIVILAGGESKRMRSDLPKVLHPLGGRPLLAWVLERAHQLTPHRIMIVASPNLAAHPQFQTLLSSDIHVVIQEKARGTGNAVQTAAESEAWLDGSNTLVLFGDTPFLTHKTLLDFWDHHQKNHGFVSLLGIRPPDPTGYGRLITPDDTPFVTRIVEEKDADEEVRQIPLCSGGVMLLGPQALDFLPQLAPHNKATEYYLTDLVALGHQEGHLSTYQEAAFEEVLGINTCSDLAHAEAVFQNQRRAFFLSQGVKLHDPSSTYFSFDTSVESDVTLYPHVFLGPGVTLKEGATVLPFSVLEKTVVSAGARVGPFCHLRGHTTIGENATVGNFVEIKNSTLEKDVAAKHLTYLGDTTVGEGANIGAGTITCNYDGQQKYPTTIGAGAFIGSNVSLIAPMTIGENAFVGAGSVITQSVSPDTLAVARARQEAKPRKR